MVWRSTSRLMPSFSCSTVLLFSCMLLSMCVESTRAAFKPGLYTIEYLPQQNYDSPNANCLGNYIGYEAKGTKVVLVDPGTLNPPLWKVSAATKGSRSIFYFAPQSRPNLQISYEPNSCKSTSIYLSPKTTVWNVTQLPSGLKANTPYAYATLSAVERSTCKGNSSALIAAPTSSSLPPGKGCTINQLSLFPPSVAPAPYFMIAPYRRNTQKLVGTRTPWREDNFGSSIAMGSQTMLAASEDCGIYLFRRPTPTVHANWSRLLLPNALSGKKCESSSGRPLAASSDRVIVGTPCSRFPTLCKTSLPLLQFKGPSWNAPPTKIAPPQGASRDFAVALAISDGHLAVGDPSANNKAGTIFIYTLTNNKWTYSYAIPAPKEAKNKGFGYRFSFSFPTLAVVTDRAFIYTLPSPSAKTATLQSVILSGKNETTNSIAVYKNASLAIGLIREVPGKLLGEIIAQTIVKSYVFVPNKKDWIQDDEFLVPSKTKGPDYTGNGGILGLAMPKESSLLVTRVEFPRESVSGFAAVYQRTKTGKSWSKWSKEVDLSPTEQYTYDLYGRPVAAVGDTYAIAAPGSSGEVRRRRRNLLDEKTLITFSVSPGAVFVTDVSVK